MASIFPLSMFPNLVSCVRIVYGQDSSLGRTETPTTFAMNVPASVQELDPAEQMNYHAIAAAADTYIGFRTDPNLYVHDQVIQTDVTPPRTFVVVKVENECGVNQLWGAYCLEVTGQ